MIFWGRSLLCLPLPGKATKLFFSTSPQTLSPRFDSKHWCIEAELSAPSFLFGRVPVRTPLSLKKPRPRKAIPWTSSREPTFILPSTASFDNLHCRRSFQRAH